MSTEKQDWLLWDVDSSSFWKHIGDGHYDHAEGRGDAARFSLTEARGLAETLNDPANDPSVALVPA